MQKQSAAFNRVSDVKGENNGETVTTKLTGTSGDETRVHEASSADAGHQGLRQGGIWSKLRSFMLYAGLMLLALVIFDRCGGVQIAANFSTSGSEAKRPLLSRGVVGTAPLAVGLECVPTIGYCKASNSNSSDFITFPYTHDETEIPMGGCRKWNSKSSCLESLKLDTEYCERSGSEYDHNNHDFDGVCCDCLQF